MCSLIIIQKFWLEKWGKCNQMRVHVHIAHTVQNLIWLYYAWPIFLPGMDHEWKILECCCRLNPSFHVRCRIWQRSLEDRERCLPSRARRLHTVHTLQYFTRVSTSKHTIEIRKRRNTPLPTVEKRINIGVCFPICSKIFAFVYLVMSWVTSKTPWAAGTNSSRMKLNVNM